MEGANAGYALGDSKREIERLSVQARVLEPFTRRMLDAAGVSKGMRVLDVGSGAGDVALLCAAAVGPEGKVLGIDRSPAAVEAATLRTQAAGVRNVSFVVGDAADLVFEGRFDAVVGRLVLMHQPDPVATLRKLTRMLRGGGVVAFQEFDIQGAQTFPHAPTFERCLEWITAAFTKMGTDTRMGVKLYSAFVAAGLPAPSMSLDAGIWGGADNPGAVLLTDVVRSLLPIIVKHEIASEDEVAIDTVQERMQAELRSTTGVAIAPLLIGAWAKLN